ncbi:MAG TPA: 2-oxoacid:ferredoxin oxidoreductase subunit gamma [Anaerolineae bacterium]|nr:2-oxoacid:ferredoxin oxidoreductase subunit gamma [Anaerolineae bacterium]
MREEVIIAGFGGQGVLFAGQLLAYSGLKAGKHVSWWPSYGAAMRGGTANCTVIISDEEIASPVVAHPSAAMVMNRPSMDKFEPLVKPGGVLVVNTSLVTRSSEREDITVVEVPANAIADELGNPRLANMAMVGALIGTTRMLPLETVVAALEEHMPERHRHLLDLNKAALRRGVAIAAGLNVEA